MENIINEFKEPTREIKTLQSLAKWTKSEAYKDLLGLILSINDTVKRTSFKSQCDVSPAIEKVRDMLTTIESWIDQYPPCEQPQRFGNKSFREWHKKLLEESETIIAPLLPENSKGAVAELKAYIHDSFGNSTRIDYGTGHETCFVFFLCCLYKLHVLVESDNLALVNVVFKKYLDLCRRLQMTYRMEPAGSQGVWGLDDFQFIPFIWGSSQLIDHPKVLVEHFTSEHYIKQYSEEYMFLQCIEYINKVKQGPFSEHSNVLWGITSVPYWNKVNQGLIKMYKHEVLSKFPVVQHFVFGNIMPITEARI